VSILLLNAGEMLFTKAFVGVHLEILILLLR
jgi:hypothetical protein